ncbi:MAG: spermidine/putrescine ABC transporter substrate-binding protein [Clostridiales bacterium]|nr:spermidine/putrescine ABC transporter substrate-binding protein [Clostridiales bacterium]
MKKILCLALCALMILAVVGCKKDASTGAQTEKTDGANAPDAGDELVFADGDQYDTIGGELNILNWGEYIDPDLIEIFEKETGVKINYVEMTSNEEMLIKLRAADGLFDLCFPSDYIIEQMIREDMLLPLDYSLIPNAKNIDPKMSAFTNVFDPGSKYSLPYMWGTVGILYNTKMVEEDVDSWGILWDEKYTGQIWMYDSMRDTLGITLKYLGYDLNTRNEAEVAAARDKLIEQAPIRKGFGTDNMRTSMINNKGALGVIYSGDAYAAIEENEDLAYVVPKEGSNVWYDNVVIPKTAKNVAAAHAFINFLNDGNVAARNTEFICYSTPNAAAMERLDESFTEDETYNPSQEVLDRCEVFHDLGDFVDVFSAAWSKVISSN